MAMTSLGCRNDIAEIKAVEEAQHLPIQTTYNASYIYSVSGKQRNKLNAAKLEQFEGESAYMKATGGFRIEFLDSLESLNAALTARHGWYYQAQSKLIAEDSVVLVNAQAEKLETEKLIFLQDSDRIYTDSYVTITTRNGVFHGKGLTSNASLTKFKILQPTGDLYVKPAAN